MKLKRIIAFVLSFAMIMSIVALTVASATTIPVSKATYKCVTWGNNLFGRISRVTFKNTQYENELRIKASATDCTVYPLQGTLYYNGSVLFTISTSFGKVGKTYFKIEEVNGNNISFDLSSSGTELIVWID